LLPAPKPTSATDRGTGPPARVSARQHGELHVAVGGGEQEPVSHLRV